MMCRYGVVVFVAVLFVQGCFAVQTWNREPEDVEVNPGGSVILPCKIYNKQGDCSWQKNGRPSGMFDAKYEWAGNIDSGDCSLRVMDAGVVDDADWECQVTASTFSADDALTSKIARLIVRVPPASPQLEVNTLQVPPSGNFTVKTGEPAAIKCIARYGNPPATIKWFVGNTEIDEEFYSQVNISETDKPKTWQAVSSLEFEFRKADNGVPLQCVSIHQTYGRKSREALAILDVQYPPVVSLEGAPSGDVEEGVDTVSLRCVADANPRANILWRLVPSTNVFSFQEEVTFSPVQRKHAGTYTCEARNSVGASDFLSVDIEVKYSPTIIETGPSPQMTVALHNMTVMDCQADGDPAPKFTWLQRIHDSQETIQRGHNSSLVLHDVSYQHQGDYVCIASNTINGEERSVQSSPISLQVMGAPQVLRYSVNNRVDVQKGHDALIEIVFCSDPVPSRASWQWGSVQLDAGAGNGRYEAESLSKASSEDCYNAKLKVKQANDADERNYYLNVENENGADKYGVSLSVSDGFTMSTVIGVVIFCLVVVVIITLLVLFAFKKEIWCFSQKGGFKPQDLENDKTDLEGQKGANGNTPHSAKENGNNPQSDKQQQQQSITEKR